MSTACPADRIPAILDPAHAAGFTPDPARKSGFPTAEERRLEALGLVATPPTLSADAKAWRLGVNRGTHVVVARALAVDEAARAVAR
jgi:hypothetical protein